MQGFDNLEHKFSPLFASEVLEEGTRIEGYASYFGLADKGGDVVVAGAYAKSLAALAAAGGRVKMLWQHDPAQPIGVWDEVFEDAKGLYVKGRLLCDVEKGREAAALVAAGGIDGLSIGYRTVRAAKNDQGQRMLSEIELWEVSLVTFPMLSEARVGSKSEALETEALRELAAVFDAAAQELAQD